jgi:hypothetical protein
MTSFAGWSPRRDGPYGWPAVTDELSPAPWYDRA